MQKTGYSISIRECFEYDRLSERLNKRGEHALSNAERTAILIRTETHGRSAVDNCFQQSPLRLSKPQLTRYEALLRQRMLPKEKNPIEKANDKCGFSRRS